MKYCEKDAGCSSELDYVEQTSWILFLKYIDDLEKEKQISAELAGKIYKGIISPEFQWSVWAVPKGADGRLDHHKALTGDDLTDFVNQKLFPYFKKFKADAEHADTIEYKIGEIFSELKNRIQSGYNLREVINLIDGLRFGSNAEKHEMSNTRKIWYYQLNLDRNLGKTNPLNENDLNEFVNLQKTKADSANSWTVNIADVNTDNYDLSVKNPNKKEEANISGAVKVKQPVSQVSKIGSVLYLMTFVFIRPQGQTTWNTDFADDSDLHVWREPYVWATSTGATVDADAHGYDLPFLVFDQ